jgi:hypothetical protein
VGLGSTGVRGEHAPVTWIPRWLLSDVLLAGRSPADPGRRASVLSGAGRLCLVSYSGQISLVTAPGIAFSQSCAISF